MTRTIVKTAIAAVLIVLCAALLLPGTVKAQDPIGCWQEGALNGPQTCICTSGSWKWLQPYGQGFCPWDEAGKTGAIPFNQQQEEPAVQPTATSQIIFLYPEKQEEENQLAVPYYDPPSEIIQPYTSQDAVEEALGFVIGLLVILVLFAIVLYGFYREITK